MSGEWSSIYDRDGLRWFIQKGWSDAEILDWLDGKPYTLDDEVMNVSNVRSRNLITAALFDLRREAQPSSPAPNRPRNPPDLRAAIQRAVDELVPDQTVLTWETVTTRIALHLGISLNPDALAKRARDEKLPHPSDPRWLPRSG